MPHLHPFQVAELHALQCDKAKRIALIKAWTNKIPALEPVAYHAAFFCERLDLTYPYDRALMDGIKAQLLALGWTLDREVTEAQLCKHYEDPAQYWTYADGCRLLKVEFSDAAPGSTCYRRTIAHTQTPRTPEESYTFEYCQP